MTALRLTSLCIAAALAPNANAFTVAPPLVIDVPTPSFSTSSSVIQTSSSNLPSQLQLLDKVGSLTVAASAATAPAPAPAAAKPAKAAAPISIVDISYNGNVPRTEADEFVVVKNNSKDTIDVSGYFIYPATSGTQGSTFYFPKGSAIKPNASVRIYTNEIHKETGGYSWSSGKALWNNNGGLAVLKDSNGKKLGEYKYVASDK
ncbi:unnamed protein product [Pseudo-nitzschia multistriata]|uniref:LTD domain-containing protein n=1 Tax=Pseudo-nitzschia multistriata TaxID=183589 RepID=A0A448YYI4_9STRA|nr:unnamed protein product [Pseudo-nitzschia multistriata]